MSTTTTTTHTRIKICGIRNPDSARAAVDAGADAIGLVFIAGSPRAVTFEEAEAVLRVLPPFVEPVGLFANAPAAMVLDTCRRLGLRTAQLHGREAPAIATAIAPVRAIKALAFDDNAAARLADWTPQSVPNLIAILWDAPPPPDSRMTGRTGTSGGSGTAGGNGQPFDWAALAALLAGDPAARACPSILAGGLQPNNVAQAIAKVRPFAVDVSTGVESSRGVKDPALIAAFCQAVRDADAALR